MKFGILSQWYAPEPGPASLPSVLAEGLRERGHDVQVVTGFPNYPLGRVMDGYRMRPVLDEVRNGVNVRRVALYPSHDASTLKRLANYGSFGTSATALGLSALRDCDAVWVNYSPITIAAPMLASRYLQGVPQVTHVLDLWPDTLHASGLRFDTPAGRLAESILHRWCNTMYQASESVAYISPGVGKVLAGRGVPESKLHYIPMWADEDVFCQSDASLRTELDLPEDAIVILYAGAMGEAQGLETLIEACRLTPDLPYVCVLAGSGTAEDDLRSRAERVAQIRFIGRVPQEKMTALCATADLNFVGLRGHESSRITMPSKTQAGLAAGKPLLVSADGDVADVARSSDACLVCAPDAEALAAQIQAACDLGRSGLRAMGVTARDFYDQHFSARSGIDAIERLLIEAASRGRQESSDMDELTYGPLRTSDVTQLAILHRNAFPDFFLSSLGDRFLREFYTSFLTDPTAVAVIARRGDMPVGAVVGTTTPGSFFKNLVKRRLPGFFLASAEAALRDPRKIPRLLGAVRYRGEAGPTGVTGALLSSICVDPREQGTGVGANMVRRWMALAEQQGAESAYLTTDRDDNEVVNAFYARLGWTLNDSFTTDRGRRMNVYGVQLATFDESH